MNIVAAERAAERAAGAMEVLCWDTRDGGLGRGAGTASKSGCILVPLPSLQPGMPTKGEILRKKCTLRGLLWGDDIFQAMAGPGEANRD